MSKWADATDTERAKAPKEIFAGPGTAYPIADADDLHKAIQALGRSSDPATTKAGIIRRARALDLANLLPESWHVSDGDGDTDDARGASEARAFAGARHSKSDATHIQNMHDSAVALGATCPIPDVTTQPGYTPPLVHREPVTVAMTETDPTLRMVAVPLPRWFTDATEPPDWVPYLPTPTTFAHPQYGEVNLTPERIARFVTNFNAGIYQPVVPLDGEHQTKLSGAMAWIRELRQNDDGSADARVEWTPRGKKLYTDGAYKYVSPEWYDEWTDPATGDTHRDVVIGGALTTRPFFKAPHLRPLAASEHGAQPDAGERSQGMADTATETATVSPAQFSELQQQFAELMGTVRTLTEERDQAKQAAEAAQAETASRDERIAALEKTARDRRFAEEVRHWTGNPAANVARLEKLAARFGEESDDFREECRERRAFAETAKMNAAVGGSIYRTVGSDLRGDGENAGQRLQALAEARAKEKGITVAKAMTELITAEPALYLEATDVK